MKKKTILIICVIAFATCLIYIHRRAIRAFLKHEEIPKAPSWHFWVKPENRK